MKTKRDKFFIIVIFSAVLISGLGYKYYNNFNNKNMELNEISENTSDNKDLVKEDDNDNNDIIMVHIDGEVKKPDLYSIKKDTRLKELIELAGGLKDTADIKKINYAFKLKDEMKIIIPKIGDTENEISETNFTSNTKDLININNSEEDELCKLTGIGKGKAKQIIEYRKKNKFKKIEDIMNVSGIGRKTFEKIKDEITVD